MRGASTWLVAVALLTGIPEPANGQSPPPTAPAAPAQAAAPEAIALPDVAGRAEELEVRLASIRQQAAPDPAVVAIEEALVARKRRLAGSAEQAREQLAGALTLDRLAELERKWLREGDALAAWRRTVTARAAQLEERLTELERDAQVWSLTRQAAADAPEAVRQRIAGVRTAIRDARREVDGRRGALLTLQTQVAEEERRVAEMLVEIRSTRSVIRSRLFTRDSPRAWDAVASLEDPGLLLEQVQEALRRDFASLRSFAADRSEPFAGHLLLFAVVVALVLFGRRRLAGLPADDPDLTSARVVFERPYAVALLVAVVLVPTLYPRAPHALHTLAGLALLVPMLRLLPRLVEPSTRPAVYALAAFYVVHVIRDLLAGTPVLERALFTLEMVAAIGLLLLLLHPRRLADLHPDTHLPSPLWLGLRVALALLAAALGATLLGYTVLASLLGGGVFVSAYALLILYGVVRVVRAAIRIALRSRGSQRLRMVRAHGPMLQRRARRTTALIATAGWAAATLEGFALLGPALAALGNALTASFEIGAVTVSVGDVLAFVLTLAAAWALSRLLRFVLEEDVFPRFSMGRGVAYATSSTLHYGLLFAGFLLAVAAAGIDLNRFTLLAGAFGVGLGFGLQAIVNNFVSGLILLYERPVQVGDTIEVGGLTGEVKRIGIRSSTVRTWQGAEVIVPNAALITDSVVNWTLSDRQRRLEIPVGVAYGTDPERVIRILTGVARANPEILDEPAPLALFRGFGESSLDFELRAWTARFERGLVTTSDLILAIHVALREAGIEIPFPQRDLHLRSVVRAAAASPGREPAPERPAAEPPLPGSASGED